MCDFGCLSVVSLHFLSFLFFKIFTSGFFDNCWQNPRRNMFVDMALLENNAVVAAQLAKLFAGTSVDKSGQQKPSSKIRSDHVNEEKIKTIKRPKVV